MAAKSKGTEPNLYPTEIEDLNDAQLDVLRTRLMQNTELQSLMRKRSELYKNSSNLFPKYNYGEKSSVFRMLEN